MIFAYGAIKFFTKTVMEDYKKNIVANLDKAALLLVNDVVKSFGSPQALSVGGVKNSRGKSISEKKYRGSQHSASGEPPFVQTGHLRRSITFDSPNDTTRRVGSTLKAEGSAEHSYAFYMEMGTGKMAARPYLRPALLRNRKAILRTVAHG